MAAITIQNEHDAWALLQRCRASNELDTLTIRFIGWPRLENTLHQGDGKLTPEICRGVGKVEQAIYRAYALCRTGNPDTRHLAVKDRYQLAPECTVVPGSKGSYQSRVRNGSLSSERAKSYVGQPAARCHCGLDHMTSAVAPFAGHPVARMIIAVNSLGVVVMKAQASHSTVGPSLLTGPT